MLYTIKRRCNLLKDLKILIADDEPNIRMLITDFLENEGFSVIEAEDGIDALEKFREYKNVISLIILDIMMPRMNGFETLKEIRNESDIPVIILTAKTEELDELAGFKYGADDYIQKPFIPSVLVARVKNKLKNDLMDIIKVGGITINLSSRTVFANNKEIELTPKEYDLLLILSQNKDKAISRSSILKKVWNIENDDSRTIDTHIKQLRLKLLDCNLKIDTIRSFGYMLTDV
jgi:DNA-binding response OmpR family regulator